MTGVLRLLTLQVVHELPAQRAVVILPILHVLEARHAEDVAASKFAGIPDLSEADRALERAGGLAVQRVLLVTEIATIVELSETKHSLQAGLDVIR